MAISRLIAVLQKNGAVTPSSIERQVVAQRISAPLVFQIFGPDGHNPLKIIVVFLRFELGNPRID